MEACGTWHARNVDDQEESAQGPSMVNHVFERDPKNYTDAMRSSKRESWRKEIGEELTALEDNDVR